MKIPEMIKAMKISISEVLEQMFFLPIDKVEAAGDDSPAWEHDPNVIAASVGFEGKSSGTFILSVPSGMAESITADFLGISPEVLSAEQIGGTVKEMINMLAGNSLSAYDPGTSFELGIPELIDENQKRTGLIDVGIETLDGFMTLHMAVR